MTTPSQRASTGTRQHRFRTGIVVSAVAAASLCTPLHAQSNNLSGTVALSSQLVERGMAITPVTPIAQGALSWTSASGWALGVSAGTEIRSPGHSSEALAQIGHYWTLSSDWRMQAGVAYYAYPDNPGGTAFDRVETSVNGMYRDVLTFGLSAIHLTRGGDHQLKGAADVDFRWPLPWHLAFSAGAGVTQPLLPAARSDYGGHEPNPSAALPPYGGWPRVSSYYGYGHVGLVWVYGRWQVELDRIATAPNVGRQPGGLETAPWVGTISRTF
jgi:uncharacterized protein (TIGR02001 family)